MNPAAITVMPLVSNNPSKQSNSIATNSTAKFGDILENTVSTNVNGTELKSTKTELASEQKKMLENLLGFLKVESLSELKDGNLIENLLNDENFGENAALLKLLKNQNGDAESVIAELLASGINLNQSQVDENSIVSDAALQSEILSVLSTNETQNQNDLNIPSEIYALLQKLDSLDMKDWSKLDLNATGNVLKLAKIQDLLSAQKEMSQDSILLQKEIKNLLESISGKLEKWLGNQSNKTGSDPAFSVLLESGTNKSLDVVKQVYRQMITSNGEMTDKALGSRLSLKTSESNTESSGLPFQMTKLEQYVLTAPKSGQAINSEQFIKSFENILSKSNFTNANGVQKLLIRLNPENLGSLRIELVQKDGTMVAKILATTAQAKELLDNQAQGLKQAFTNQNIQVEKIEISQQISTYNSERFAPRDQGQHEQHEQQQTAQETIEDDETDFTDSFSEALLNLEV